MVFSDVKYRDADLSHDLSRSFAWCRHKSDWLRIDCEWQIYYLAHLINKGIDSVDYRFLDAVLSAAGFGPYYRTSIPLLYVIPCTLAQVKGVRSQAFVWARSIRPISALQYVHAFEHFLRK